MSDREARGVLADLGFGFTQRVYDAGYSAGFQAGLHSGQDIGLKVGREMERDESQDTKRLDWLEEAVPSGRLRQAAEDMTTWGGTVRSLIDALRTPSDHGKPE